MQMRSRRLAPWLLLAAAGAVVTLAACVGDDPSLVSSTPGSDGGGGQADGPVTGEGSTPGDAAGTDAGDTDGGADASPAPARLVFVTKADFAAAPSGAVGGFDDACNAAAAASTKADVKAAKFVAWVSITAERAATHAQVTGFTGAFQTPDGTMIAQSGADLLDGTIAAFLDHDENGEARAAGKPWTGTTSAGSSDADMTCADWTSVAAAKNATQGTTTEKNGRWTKSVPGSCAAVNPVYCFQVP